MDFDLEIVSEEGDCPDPLFNSIMSAMNSMKEATADKIYQRIQKEGTTNYSKPQVDRALASALKYGIFEIRNNRYRVRDDVVDDEDTVYWKVQRKREQTPYRTEEAAHGHYGTCINPETDNRRYRRLCAPDQQECPNCGRHKGSSRKRKKNSDEEEGSFETQRAGNQNKKTNKISRGKYAQAKRAPVIKNPIKKRKSLSDSESSEIIKKFQKRKGTIRRYETKVGDKKTKKSAGKVPEEKKVKSIAKRKPKRMDEGSDDSDYRSPSMTSPSEDDSASTRSSPGRKKYIRHRKHYPRYTCEAHDEDELPNRSSNVDVSKSNKSIKSEATVSDVTDGTSGSGCRKKRENQSEKFNEDLPSTSRDASGKDQTNQRSSCKDQNNRSNFSCKDQPCPSRNLCSKQCTMSAADQPDQKNNDRKPDWMERNSNPQDGIVKESNNALTIEPAEPLAFSPQGASYIS